jgi:type II secretory pathway component GspD/PulD (secretin)
VLKIVALKNAKAADLAKTLNAVFGKADGLAVATDDRTNSLILQGKPEKLLEVAALIQELEERTASEKK